MEDTQTVDVVDQSQNLVYTLTFRQESNQYSIERPFVVDSYSHQLDHKTFNTLLRAAQSANWEILYQFDGALLPLYCPECKLHYTKENWRIWAKYDDPPDSYWLDSYRGVCPQSHQRMIAD